MCLGVLGSIHKDPPLGQTPGLDGLGFFRSLADRISPLKPIGHPNPEALLGGSGRLSKEVKQPV